MNQTDRSTIFATSTRAPRCRSALQAVILGLMTVSCTNANSTAFPDVESILCVPSPKPPITTSADAICFAAYVNGAADSLRSAQKQAKYDGWIADGRRGQDFDGWVVHIRSTGTILPSYVCTLSFSENGSFVSKEPMCHYNK